MRRELDSPADFAAFDVRRALAALFAILGILLVGFGQATRNDERVYIPSGGVNVNLRWGMVLLGFSVLMALLSFVSSRASRTRALGATSRGPVDSPPQNAR